MKGSIMDRKSAKSGMKLRDNRRTKHLKTEKDHPPPFWQDKPRRQASSKRPQDKRPPDEITRDRADRQKQKRLAPRRGERVGEAKNPGPPREYRACITNPTVIAHKHAQYIDQDADMYTASETAATKAAQHLFASRMRKAHYHTQWSAPLEPAHSKNQDRESYRGKAAGVAVISKTPERPTFRRQQTKAEHASRMLEVYTHFGCTPIRVFVIYGLVSNQPGAHQWTETMLQDITQIIQTVQMPTMILGDYNGDIQQFPSVKNLQEKGFCTLDDLHWSRHQQEMPPTCRGATRPDTGLLSPELAARLTQVQVVNDGSFDTHALVHTQAGRHPDNEADPGNAKRLVRSDSIGEKARRTVREHATQAERPARVVKKSRRCSESDNPRRSPGEHTRDTGRTAAGI